MRVGTKSGWFASMAATALAAGAAVTAVPAANAAPVAEAAPAVTYYCVYSLKVVDTEDWSGADEVFLKRGSTVIWGPRSLNNGQTGYPLYTAVSGTVLSAWDEDGGGTDAHDWIGSATINRTGTYTLQGDDAHYVLTVRSSRC